MSACPKCGHQNPDGAFICAHCGSSIQSLSQLDRSPIDIRPQPAEQGNQGFALGILIGIAWVTLVAVIVFGTRGIIGSVWLLLFLGFLGLLALVFIAEPRTRSMGCGMLAVLAVALAAAAGFLLLLFQQCCPAPL